jgi:HAD superfamily hydrolase (TIGR01509 family)
MNAALHELGLPPLHRKELRPLIGMPVRRQMLILRGMKGSIVKRIGDLYYHHFIALIEDRLRPFPGVKEALEALSDRPIGTVTTRRRAVARRMLRIGGLEAYFTAVTGGDQVSRPKPYPDLVLQAARDTCRRPSECVVVGDAPVDIQAGRAAGARTVAATYGYGDLEAMRRAKPDAEISSFSELPRVLEEMEDPES